MVGATVLEQLEEPWRWLSCRHSLVSHERHVAEYCKPIGRRTYDILSHMSTRQRFSIRTRLRPGEGCQLHPRRVTQTVNVTAISWSKARSDPKTLADGPDRTDVLRTPANRLAVFCYVTFMRQAVSSSSSPSHADGAHPYTTTESWALPFRFRGLIPDRNTWPTRLSL